MAGIDVPALKSCIPPLGPHIPVLGTGRQARDLALSAKSALRSGAVGASMGLLS
jgi:hypothetical protein